MRCPFDFLNRSYVIPRCTYDPIIKKSDKMIHIRIKHVHVEFHRGNKIFNTIIIANHIFLVRPIMDLGVIMH